MSRLYLVRHGRAEAGWDADLDPGLDEAGRQQAVAAADLLEPLGSMPVVTSPLRRCRETAEPLLERWGAEPVVDPRVGEIPSPSDDLAERAAWLAEVLAGTWPELGARWWQWRSELLAALVGLTGDAVVMTHFVAINAAIGAAVGDNRVVVRRPANGSVAVFAHDGERLHLVTAPRESDTEVL